MARLAATVHGVRHPETGLVHSFAAGEEPPDWVREVVTNPAAWEDEASPVRAAAPGVAGDYPTDNPTAAEVEEWVGNDVTRARLALDVEGNRPQGPRSTLVTKLERVASGA